MTTMVTLLSEVRMILDWSVLSSLMTLASWRVMLGFGVCFVESLVVLVLNSDATLGGR